MARASNPARSEEAGDDFAWAVLQNLEEEVWSRVKGAARLALRRWQQSLGVLQWLRQERLAGRNPFFSIIYINIQEHIHVRSTSSTHRCGEKGATRCYFQCLLGNNDTLMMLVKTATVLMSVCCLGRCKTSFTNTAGRAYEYNHVATSDGVSRGARIE